MHKKSAVRYFNIERETCVEVKQDRQCMCNVTLWHICVTIVAVETVDV